MFPRAPVKAPHYCRAAFYSPSLFVEIFGSPVIALTDTLHTLLDHKGNPFFLRVDRLGSVKATLTKLKCSLSLLIFSGEDDQGPLYLSRLE